MLRGERGRGREEKEGIDSERDRRSGRKRGKGKRGEEEKKQRRKEVDEKEGGNRIY